MADGSANHVVEARYLCGAGLAAPQSGRYRHSVGAHPWFGAGLDRPGTRTHWPGRRTDRFCDAAALSCRLPDPPADSNEQDNSVRVVAPPDPAAVALPDNDSANTRGVTAGSFGPTFAAFCRSTPRRIRLPPRRGSPHRTDPRPDRVRQHRRHLVPDETGYPRREGFPLVRAPLCCGRRRRHRPAG